MTRALVIDGGWLAGQAVGTAVTSFTLRPSLSLLSLRTLRRNVLDWTIACETETTPRMRREGPARGKNKKHTRKASTVAS